MGCSAQVVARCAISTTMGGCFGGTVGIIVQLIYSKLSGGQAVWWACAPSCFSAMHTVTLSILAALLRRPHLQQTETDPPVAPHSCCMHGSGHACWQLFRASAPAASCSW